MSVPYFLVSSIASPAIPAATCEMSCCGKSSGKDTLVRRETTVVAVRARENCAGAEAVFNYKSTVPFGDTEVFLRPEESYLRYASNGQVGVLFFITLSHLTTRLNSRLRFVAWLVS